MMPEGVSADNFRAVALKNFNISFGNGLSKIADKVFRIGHLGYFNDLMLMGTLCGVEMGLEKAGVPHKSGGAQAAMDYLAGRAGTATTPGGMRAFNKPSATTRRPTRSRRLSGRF